MKRKNKPEAIKNSTKGKAQSSDASHPFLFVYGTLKRGNKFHHELAKQTGLTFLGSARIKGRLYRLRNVAFPGAVPTRVPNSFVHGQLFSMQHPQMTLTALDAFEEVDEGLFRRALVDVWIEGERKRAWTYFYARPVTKARLLSEGVYSSE